MRQCQAVLFMAALGLASCSASNERRAADACLAETANRLAGKQYDVDVKQLAASTTAGADGMLQLSGPIVFDRDLSGEYAQTIDCRVRFEAGEPVVIFLQFSWSMDDVKKSSPSDG